MEAQAGYGGISSVPPWRSTRHCTEEANAHNYRNTLAEQHVCWQEQGRNPLNFQHAGFERATQEFEQAARDELHVAVAQDTELFRVAGDALENQRRSLLNEPTAELGGHHRQNHEHLQEYQQGVRRPPVRSSTRSPSSTGCAQRRRT